MKITKNEYAMLYFNFFKQDYYLKLKNIILNLRDINI